MSNGPKQPINLPLHRARHCWSVTKNWKLCAGAQANGRAAGTGNCVLKKQSTALREVNDFHLKVYEQLVHRIWNVPIIVCWWRIPALRSILQRFHTIWNRCRHAANICKNSWKRYVNCWWRNDAKWVANTAGTKCRLGRTSAAFAQHHTTTVRERWRRKSIGKWF